MLFFFFFLSMGTHFFLARENTGNCLVFLVIDVHFRVQVASNRCVSSSQTRPDPRRHWVRGRFVSNHGLIFCLGLDSMGDAMTVAYIGFRFACVRPRNPTAPSISTCFSSMEVRGVVIRETTSSDPTNRAANCTTVFR